MTRTPADYSKSVIYKICCKDPTIEDIYVGSTTNFTKRKAQHKKNCNNANHKGYNNYKYQFIRDNGGFDNWDMVLIKDYSTDTKRKLEMEERRVIEELKPTLNKQIPTRTYKEYREDNKEYIQDINKEWYEKNKERILKKQKEKITCDKCGSIVRKYGIIEHKKSTKCINYN